LSKQDVSAVTDMDYMFANATLFSATLADWSVENVVTMEYLFSYTESFNGVSIVQWNITNGTNIMGMLCEAAQINPFVLPQWNSDSFVCP
jgi:Mycoplasma protein of unknown function, DUF285